MINSIFKFKTRFALILKIFSIALSYWRYAKNTEGLLKSNKNLNAHDYIYSKDTSGETSTKIPGSSVSTYNKYGEKKWNFKSN